LVIGTGAVKRVAPFELEPFINYRLDFGFLCFNNDSVARVVIEQLTKIFDRKGGEPIRALKEVNLTIEDKELMVLVGPSGCGKTTLLRLISGLDELTEGSISIGGRSMKNVPPGERDVAMVFQNYALYPHMSVYENLAFGLRIRKCPRGEMDKRVRETAELLGLMDCLARLPKELSGGQRQRVALGRAIVRRPELYLFDEPLSNLDAPMRVQMRTEISKLHKHLGATMLYVTHDQVEAMTMGDRIAVMNEGALQQVGEPMSIYKRPANLFVAGFIGSPQMNFFNAVVTQKDGSLFVEQEGSGNCTIAGPRISERLGGDLAASLKSYAGKKIVLGVRPEKLSVSKSATGPNGSTIEAVVEVIEPLGAETFVYLGRGKNSLVARMNGGEQARVNEKLAVGFDLSDAQFFDAQTGKAITMIAGTD
jgi:multiple sugar transport system ATP-binding protein